MVDFFLMSNLTIFWKIAGGGGGVGLSTVFCKMLNCWLLFQLQVDNILKLLKWQHFNNILQNIKFFTAFETWNSILFLKKCLKMATYYISIFSWQFSPKSLGLEIGLSWWHLKAAVMCASSLRAGVCMFVWSAAIHVDGSVQYVCNPKNILVI